MGSTYSYEDLKRDIRSNLEKLWIEQNSFEIIVTYDCIESNFRNRLRDDLLKKNYNASLLTESTYLLPIKLTSKQCCDLGMEIVDLYSKVLNESKMPITNSTVRIIFPKGKEFGQIEIPLKHSI